MLKLILYLKVCKYWSSLEFACFKLESGSNVIKYACFPMNVIKEMSSMTNQVHSYKTRNSNTFSLFPAQTNIRLFGKRFQGVLKFFISAATISLLNPDWKHFSLADSPLVFSAAFCPFSVFVLFPMYCKCISIWFRLLFILFIVLG